jgi:hypothetical protein
MASWEMSESEFLGFLRETLGAAAAVSRGGAVHFVCMDGRHRDSVPAAEEGSKLHSAIPLLTPFSD